MFLPSFNILTLIPDQITLSSFRAYLVNWLVALGADRTPDRTGTSLYRKITLPSSTECILPNQYDTTLPNQYGRTPDRKFSAASAVVLSREFALRRVQSYWARSLHCRPDFNCIGDCTLISYMFIMHCSFLSIIFSPLIRSATLFGRSFNLLRGVCDYCISCWPCRQSSD
jgi:hypothetical protein